jgi:hypothetical protein
VVWVVNGLEEHIGGTGQEILNVLGKGILVLLEEVDCGVGNWTSVMLASEHHVSIRPWALECLGRVRVQCGNAFLCEGKVRGLWESSLLIKDGEDGALLGEEKSNGQRVVRKRNLGDINTFTLVFFLFSDKNVVVEVALELFVGQVNAHLFDRVELEDFEPENIEDTNSDKVRSAKQDKPKITRLVAFRREREEKERVPSCTLAAHHQAVLL